MRAHFTFCSSRTSVSGGSIGAWALTQPIFLSARTSLPVELDADQQLRGLQLLVLLLPAPHRKLLEDLFALFGDIIAHRCVVIRS